MSELNCDFCGLKLFKNSFLMLPCGFLVCSDHISDIVQSKWCIVCKCHELDIDKFMNMAMNKMVLSESKLKQKKLELNGSYANLRTIRNDPKAFVSIHFQNLKNQLDLRRSELKKEITKQIDECYDQLITSLQQNQQLYLNKIELRLTNVELENNDVENDDEKKLNIKDRLELIEHKLDDFEQKIKTNYLLEFDLNQYKLFNFFKGTYDVQKVFGKLDKENWTNFKKFECISTVRVHSNQVFCIDELDTGEIVTSSKDKTIKIWNLYTGNCVQTFFGHTNWVLQFLILMNKNEMISCSGDGCIKKWNLKTGKCLCTIQASNKEVWSIVLTKNDFILSGCGEGLIKKWNIKNSECEKIYKEHNGTVYSLTLVDSESFLSSSADNTIIHWNYASGDKLRLFQSHSSYVWKMFVLNEYEFISGAADGSIKLWNLNESKCQVTFKHYEKCIRNFVKLNENLILTCSDDGLVKLLDLKSKNFTDILNTNNNGLYSIKILSNGLMISSSKEGIIKIWRQDSIK